MYIFRCESRRTGDNELMYIINKDNHSYCLQVDIAEQTHAADLYKSFWLFMLTIISHYISNNNYIIGHEANKNKD